MDYLYPLRSGDQFSVGLNLERVSRVRFGFLQDIFRLSDSKPILKAKVIGTALNEAGKPCLPRELEELIDRQIQTTISDKT
jgi:acyl-CoA thioester hydrolase